MAKQILLKTPRFSVEQVTFQTEDGARHDRAVVRHPGAVAVLPLLNDDRICLIRNERAAVGRQLVELPAGTLEPNEPPEQTARRELLEETGYQASQMTRVHAFYLSPGILDERMHVFVAEQLTKTTPKRKAGERIENLIVSWQEALQMLDRGDIEDAKTIVGLLCYERIRQSRGSETARKKR